MDEVTEQGIDHSDEVNSDDLAKLEGLLGDDGSMPEVEKEIDKDEAAPEDAPKQTKPEQPESEEDSPELIEAEYEGKVYKVPAELKDALLRQADYTRKTQEIANTRTTVDQQRAEVQRLAQDATKFVSHYAAVHQIDNQLEQLKQVNWAELQANDPIKNLELRQAWTELHQSRAGILAQVEQAKGSMRQAEEQQLRQTIAQGVEVLAKAIPDWGAEKQRALLETGVKNYGFKPEELAQMSDPRQVQVLHDAYLYRQLMEKQTQVQKQVKVAPPKVVRPTASHEDRDRTASNEALGRLRRSGSDDDAVAALKALMG